MLKSILWLTGSARTEPMNRGCDVRMASYSVSDKSTTRRKDNCYMMSVASHSTL